MDGTSPGAGLAPTADSDGTTQANNAAAARAVGELVRTTLGPHGMDKMIVGEDGDVTVTSDGATVLREMDLDHPFAGLVATVGLDQADTVGDGTSTAVTIASELLDSVETLLEQGLHPNSIVRGFQEANRVTQEAIDDVARDVSAGETGRLADIVANCLVGTVSERDRRPLAETVASAISDVADGAPEREYPDRIAVESVPGQPVETFETVRGAVVQKNPIHESMPTAFDDASILLVDHPLEVDGTERDSQLDITSVSQYREQVAAEDAVRQETVDQVLASGADVVFCQKRVDDLIAKKLAREGVLVTRFTVKPDVEFLSRMFDVPIVADIADVADADLGHARVRHEDDPGRFVVESDTAPVRTVLLHGSTETVAETLERGVEDAVEAAIGLLVEGRVVPGAGATEVELAQRIREAAPQTDGRQQLAMGPFADALESIPRVLAENAGLDPVTSVTQLRTAHHEGDAAAGLDVFEAGVVDAFDRGIVDGADSKGEALTSALEVANIVVHVDGIIEASDLSNGG